MNKKISFAALSLLALSLTACGADSDTAASEPAPTVTVTAEPVEVEVEVTPEACLTALTLAAEGLTVAGEVIGKVQPAAQAGFDRDVAAMEAITSSIQASNVKLEDLMPRATAATQECRSLAK